MQRLKMLEVLFFGFLRTQKVIQLQHHRVEVFYQIFNQKSCKSLRRKYRHFLFSIGNLLNLFFPSQFSLRNRVVFLIAMPNRHFAFTELFNIILSVCGCFVGLLWDENAGTESARSNNLSRYYETHSLKLQSGIFH